MATAHEDAVSIAVDQFCSEQGGYKCLRGFKDRMNDGVYGPNLLGFVTVPWNGYYNLHDAFCFAQIYTRFLDGTLLIATVPVGTGPAKDTAVVENQLCLSKGLPEEFEATVWNGNYAGSDGILKWKQPIGFVDDDVSRVSTTIEPRSVPLEIGTTKSSCTWVHLLRERGLARWPYGYKHLVVGIMRSLFPQEPIA